MAESEISAPYTIFSERRKRWTIAIASMVTFLSPVSANMYYPAINRLAHDLHVSHAKINLTITVFMIVQGIGPLFVGSVSDIYGRRPTVLLSLLVYLGVNIGLARQTSYPVLMALRCLQSLGSSTACIVCSSVAADLVPRAERGRYMIYSSLGVTLGPAIGPIVGGVLTQFFDWRSTFWFLAIFAGVMITVVLVFLPETCRVVVGNGSILPPWWNIPLVQYLNHTTKAEEFVCSRTPNGEKQARHKRPTPLDSIRVAMQKETAAIITFTTLLFCGYTSVLSTLPSQLESKYHFNALQVGLCYIPYGAGSLTSRWTIGKLIDWNFRRHARKQGIEIVQNRQVQLSLMPVEKARLQITLPVIYGAAAAVVGYGWTMNHQVNLAGPLVMLFFVSHLISGATSTLITLVIDCHVQRPATASAANNMFRCLFGAGAVAGAIPLIDAISIGWTGTMIAFVWVLFSPMLWGVYFWGHSYLLEYLSKGFEIYAKFSVIGWKLPALCYVLKYMTRWTYGSPFGQFVTCIGAHFSKG
ncbi:MFS transporter [Sclerotinia borealis F-4128]|uniref:MFS transporter n=1 Tax=Sclerotinia borealis (strain F-4128) TaxID=1432307 RepID=W9CQY7_SCLBF|nr:MFS transporter [Sclerotinia borealis F-4128]